MTVIVGPGHEIDIVSTLEGKRVLEDTGLPIFYVYEGNVDKAKESIDKILSQITIDIPIKYIDCKKRKDLNSLKNISNDTPTIVVFENMGELDNEEHIEENIKLLNEFYEEFKKGYLRLIGYCSTKPSYILPIYYVLCQYGMVYMAI